MYLRILGGLDFLSDGFVPAGEIRRVLFENVNVEGMRGRRRSGVDALGILHFVSGGLCPEVDAQCACQNYRPYELAVFLICGFGWLSLNLRV